ncbi:MAG: Gfo/Idh/MocA family oxidoreductase [Deltaproteobacteria bacterium]|nr:Gfo/Idh/MocA family oxidoreductase [Deltaproteobacteria bacterium]
MEPLRIGVVGAGAIGQYDAEEAVKSGSAKIVGVFDVNHPVARNLARVFSARVSPTYEELLDRQEIEAVLLCVPHYLHKTMAIQAADRGKHILVEKPMATTLEDANDIIATCRKRRVLLTVNFSLRYLARNRKAKALIEQGAVGDITGVQIIAHVFRERGYWMGGRSNSPDDWRASREKSGAGLLFMNVCHVIDYVYFLTGLKAARIYSEYATLGSPAEVEDIASVTIRFDNGAIGTISASTIMRGPDQIEERIWGSRGTLVLCPDGLSFYSTRPIDGKRPGQMHQIPKFRGVSCTAEWVRRFVLAVREGKAPDVAAREGWENVAFISTANLSLEKMRPLEVPLFPNHD